MMDLNTVIERLERRINVYKSVPHPDRAMRSSIETDEAALSHLKAMQDAFVERDNWIETAASAYRDVEFYQSIVRQIGEMFGQEAKTSDDGSIQQDVLALKVPELVATALKAMQWVSVEERLPADGQECIVFDGKDVCGGAMFNEGGESTGDWQDRWINDEALPFPNITHWTQLPEPPGDQT